MKKLYAIGAMALLSSFSVANAQYFDIANQVANVIQAPLNGSARYKGFLEGSYIKGLGNTEVDFLEFSTSQGMQYNSWFYMGAGLGVSVVFSHTDNNMPADYWQQPAFQERQSRTSGVMIPLFTDFRFTPFGNQLGLYLDLKLGCSFLMGNNYLRINRGYLTNQEYFYLRPSIGVKIPVSKNHPKQAVDIGATYQLLASNYWSGYYSNTAISSLGLNVAFEW